MDRRTAADRHVSIEDFCRGFYDSQVFHPGIAGTDAGQVYIEAILETVIEADPSFGTIDPVVFQRGMNAIRVALFGVALSLHLNSLELDEHIAQEIVFTKRYLEQNQEIWNAMAYYNKAIPYAEIMASTESLIASERDSTPQAHLDDVFRLSYIDAYEHVIANASAQWVRAGISPDCAARVANRSTSEETWETTGAFEVLTRALERRLGYQLNSEGRFHLQKLLRDLYADAQEAMTSVDIVAKKTPSSCC